MSVEHSKKKALKSILDIDLMLHLYEVDLHDEYSKADKDTMSLLAEDVRHMRLSIKNLLKTFRFRRP